MQRHATELLSALEQHPELRVFPLTLRASWRAMHVRSVPFFVRLLWRVPAIARRVGADVVLFSSMAPALLAVPLRQRLHAGGTITAAIPLGLDVTLPNSLYQRIVPHVLQGADLLLPISRATAAACLARGAARERTEVIPCGVDLSRFDGAPDHRAAARERLVRAAGPLPPDALLLCSVGRHVRRKGFEWFTREVMPHLPGHVCYWIAGEGPETGAIRTAIAGHGLQERVRLLGVAPDDLLRTLYAAADLFVMPNLPVPGDIEGFGIVMLEAGASGLPTLAARLDGIVDVIEEGQNGWLVPSGDAASFAARILQIDANRGQLAAASERARQWVGSRFAWPVVAERYAQALRARCTAGRARPA